MKNGIKLFAVHLDSRVMLRGAGLASEEMLLDWAALHMGQGRPEAAAAATVQGCQLLPASCALWQRRLALLAQSAATQVPHKVQVLVMSDRPCQEQVLQVVFVHAAVSDHA